MAREKVRTPYFIGGGFPVVRYWTATFANEGAESLAAYIVGMRAGWVEAAKAGCREEMADLETAGKYAVRIYEKHFGKLV